ncbi:MAG TPA: hypothetical protein VK459_28485 [Polyangiaceae bacterium]|nr:hypothetical protein [Polyangiaceae bacterium]
MGIAAALTGLVLALPGAGKDAAGDVRCYIVGPVAHGLEDVEPLPIGEHDAFPALAAGDVRTVDVLDGEQHLAVVPEREGGNRRAVLVGLVDALREVIDTIFKAAQACTELADLAQEGCKAILFSGFGRPIVVYGAHQPYSCSCRVAVRARCEGDTSTGLACVTYRIHRR